MAFHIVLNRPTDLAKVSNDAEAGLNPRHSMSLLAAELEAKVHDGSGLAPDLVDRLLAGVSGMKPLWWAMARRLRKEVGAGDVVFCTGEDIGAPVALLCGGRHRARVAMTIHRFDTPKKKLAMRLFNLRNTVGMFFAVSQAQLDYLLRDAGVPESQMRFIWDQTDTQFFAPSRASGEASSPIVVSVGLEQRNYAALAEATSGTGVDVRISGFSADTRVMSQAFPAQLPANMSRRYYAWPELLDLYRDANVAVVSLYDNSYAAGVQAVMEALACGKPLVVSSTRGLSEYLDRTDCMKVVPPENPEALRMAILSLLSDDAERNRLSIAARELAVERHSTERYVSTLAAELRVLAG